MGYEVHIEREDGTFVSLDEWCAAVEATEGIRLAREDTFAQNPATGEDIRIPRQDGDVDIYFPDDDAWIPYLVYSRGRISLKPPDDFDQPESPVRRALVRLAVRLNARVVGDGGNVYT